jgi:hypothetical protein
VVLGLLLLALLGATSGGAPAVAAAADVSAPVQAPEDLSLGALGVADQAVHGPAGSVLTSFPAPSAPLASSGSFVRIFFAHAEPDASVAKIVVAVNGVILDTVPLAAGTRAGGVFEKSIPGNVLHADGPNLLDVRFSLLAPGANAFGDLYGMVGSRTQLHYELKALDGGRPDALEDYPAGLLSSSTAPGGQAPLALVLPSRPDSTEVGALARVMADLGRRVRVSQVSPQVVADASGWLASPSSPAIALGRLDQLPVAGSLLERIGFTHGSGGWRPPRSAASLTPDAGIVAAVEVPGSSRQPVLVVTGGSDLAVARAAQALIAGEQSHLSGRYAVVDKDPTGADDSLGGTDPLRLSAILQGDPSLQGIGEHRLLFSLPARAADAGSNAQLHLQFDAGSAAGELSGLAVELNGHALELAASPPAGRLSFSADASVPARYLHPGLNHLAVLLHLAGGVGPTLSAADSTFAPPPPPQGDPGLAGLPYPFLDAGPGAGTALVVAGLDGATLQAVAAAFAALGSRAITPPPPASVTILSDARTVIETSHSLVVVGSPSWAGEVRLRRDASGEVVFRPPGSGLGSGWVMRRGPLLGDLQVLWVGGVDAKAAATAALALGGSNLGGDVLSVDSAGRASTSAGSAVTTIRTAWETWLPRLLPAAASGLLALLLLGTMALSRSPRRKGSRRSARVAVLVVLAWCFLATTAYVMVSSGAVSLLFPVAVLIVGALSLRLPRWQGLLAAVLAAAALESVEILLAGSPVVLTLGAGSAQPASRLTAGTSLSDVVATLFGMALLLITPAVAALVQRSRNAAPDPGERSVLTRRSWS